MSAKKFTRLTKLAVCENPQHNLKILYGKILRALTKLPEESAYKKYTREIIASKAAIVEYCPDIEKVVEQMQSGIPEELIIQAENELSLVRNVMYSKPWEPLISKPPEDQWIWPPSKIT